MTFPPPPKVEDLEEPCDGGDAIAERGARTAVKRWNGNPLCRTCLDGAWKTTRRLWC